MVTDVLILGAGPARAAAARVLALGGARVLLVDRHQFPRDKVCGDALIADALRALDELGLRQIVSRVAHHCDAIRIYAPNGRFTVVTGDCACVPRAVLDEVLLEGAMDAGAKFIPFMKAVGPLQNAAATEGARLQDVKTGSIRDVRASATVLATGAAVEVLQRFGVCRRPSASAIAARIYVRVPSSLAAEYDHLAISYAAAICPGYGWVFPGPENVFNLGIGFISDPRGTRRVPNLRKVLDRFVRAFPPADVVMQRGEVLTPFKGAPLRSGLSGADLARPGLLVVGEAAGLTYSFTGEGIGKALQSGIIAARALLTAGRDRRGTMRDAADAYASQIHREFEPRFRAYRRLERLLSYPRIVNLLVDRANKGTYVQSQLQSLMDETGPADGLVSPSGILHAFLS